MEKTNLDGYDLWLQKGNSSAIFIIVGFSEELSKLFETFPDVSFLGIEPKNWDAELTPWPSERIFSKRDDFQGKADEFLSFLLHRAIPFGKKALGEGPLVIGGYSLAGLFSIYSLFQTNLFAFAFSCSGSFWYPGFLSYAKQHDLRSRPKKIYFSLGDFEKNAKNKVLASVEENTKGIVDMLKSSGIDVSFVLNPGNHFADPIGRMALAISSLMESFSCLGSASRCIM